MILYEYTKAIWKYSIPEIFYEGKLLAYLRRYGSRKYFRTSVLSYFSNLSYVVLPEVRKYNVVGLRVWIFLKVLSYEVIRYLRKIIV